MRVTDAPTPVPGAYNTYLQDWPAWVVGGSIDLIYPQVYRTDAATYITTLDQQLNALPVALRSKVAPGVRASSGTPPAEVLGMVAANRARNLPGQVFWYAEQIADDLAGLQSNYFQTAVGVAGQPLAWRPSMQVFEESTAPTTFTPGFQPTNLAGSSAGLARMAAPNASPAEQVVYTLPVGATGLWSLYTSVPTLAVLSTGAPFEFVHAGGITVLAVDETSTVPGGWRPLGTFWVQAGQTTLTVRARPGQTVVADAVGLLRSRLPSGPMGTVGVGTTGSLGGLRAALHGRAGLGGTLVVQGSRTPPGSLVAFAMGLQGTAVPLFGGTLYVVPTLLESAVADALGTATTTVTIPFTTSLLGVTALAQAVALDAAGIEGVSLSNAVTATIQ